MRLLKSAASDQESDHVLGMVMNVLCNGNWLEPLVMHRNDSAFLDAINAAHNGPFCRNLSDLSRIEHSGYDMLNGSLMGQRLLSVWMQQ